jgi:hypothetical protein
MRQILVFLIIVFFVVAADAQTKSLTGTVVDAPKGMYAWAAIVIKVGNKRYYVPTVGKGVSRQKTVGIVDEVGRTVRVFYTKVAPSSDGYDGELRAIGIIEVKKPKSRK